MGTCDKEQRAARKLKKRHFIYSTAGDERTGMNGTLCWRYYESEWAPVIVNCDTKVNSTCIKLNGHFKFDIMCSMVLLYCVKTFNIWYWLISKMLIDCRLFYNILITKCFIVHIVDSTCVDCIGNVITRCSWAVSRLLLSYFWLLNDYL